VQGDEREVIFISVGYGPDASGYIAMNFGPLSSEGGERRLNVLISRAKRRCVVFSSLRADDIDLARVTGQGVRCLKAFLQFAETGRLAAADTTSCGAECVGTMKALIALYLVLLGLLAGFALLGYISSATAR
jgi:hypothetical protein